MISFDVDCTLAYHRLPPVRRGGEGTVDRAKREVVFPQRLTIPHPAGLGEAIRTSPYSMMLSHWLEVTKFIDWRASGIVRQCCGKPSEETGLSICRGLTSTWCGVWGGGETLPWIPASGVREHSGWERGWVFFYFTPLFSWALWTTEGTVVETLISEA